MTLRVRAFKPEDAPAARAVVRKVLREYRLLSAHRGAMDDLDDIPGSYLKFLVVENAGRIIGCGGLRPRGRSQAQLQRMYLLREARGRGQGRALLTRLLRYARRAGIRRVWLESSLRYQDAIRLYLRNGFEGGILEDAGCCGVILFKEFQ